MGTTKCGAEANKMSEKIGRFEIVSQLAQSSLATVYKALDTESQQTVALKVVRLDQVKDRAALSKQIFEEAEQAKPLSSHNIATLYGVGDEGEKEDEERRYSSSLLLWRPEPPRTPSVVP